MARAPLLSLLSFALAIQLLSGLANAKSSSTDKAAAQPGVQVPIVAQYVDNLTETALFHPKGWYAPNICDDKYCVYSNREIANGQGLTIISTLTQYQKIKRLEKLMKTATSKFLPDPPIFEEQDLPETNGDKGFVATAQIKRATALMELVPIIIIHKSFFNDTDEASHARLLDAAFRLLPSKTQDLLKTGMAKNHHSRKGLKEAIISHPFETNAGSTYWDGADHGKHYVVYSELFSIGHSCRPNMAFYLDGQHTPHFAAARKIQPGEPLTISYINPRQTRKERSEAAHDLWGKPCSCNACTARGDLSALAAADARFNEILDIEEQLKDMESTRVTTGMLAHYLELIEQDGLHSRLAEAYELLAYNYNYLGYEKRAKKYGSLAMQAGIVEQGPDSNDVVAMRVFTKGPREHYSWQRKLKNKKPAGAAVAGKAASS